MSRKAIAALLLAVAVGSASAILCPTTSKYNGCMPDGCLGIPTSRRTMDVVCDACGEGYVLAYGGTKDAKCECAPGWAGKGNNGVCMQCPPGTQVAAGGPIALSQCLSCPETTVWSVEVQDCLCPAGTQYSRDGSGKSTGWKHVSCKPCSGKLEYMDLNMHARKECKLCAAGLVPNTERTECVPANHPNALTMNRPQSMFGRLAALVAPADPDRANGEKDNSITAVLSDLVHIWAKNTTAKATPQPAEKASVQAVEAPKAEAPKADAPKADAPKAV